jgi:hypothetical protein
MNMLGLIACYSKFFLLHYIQLHITSRVVWYESLKAESHLYVSLAALYWAHRATGIIWFDFERHMNSRSHFVAWSQVSLLIRALLCPPMIQLRWVISRYVALQWLLLTCHCQTNWEPVVAELAARGTPRFSHLSAVPMVAVVEGLNAMLLYRTVLLRWT